MTPEEYRIEVQRTAKPHDLEYGLEAGALGLAGEAGEVADIVKKVVFHRHEFTNERAEALVKELGDVLWYLDYLADTIGVSLSDIMELNIVKLRKRYPNGWEHERSFHNGD